MPDIWFHADDYGVAKGQSERIMDCHRYGVLNSVSIIANVKDISTPLNILNSEDKDKTKIRRVLHLNFVEGEPVSDKADVDMLVDKKGFFNKSFVDILKWNYSLFGKKRRKLINQLKTEIAAQLRKVTIENDYTITGIDSHQHYHMIPIVFDSIMEVIDMDEFKNIDIKYIRIPVDPLKPVMENKGQMGDIPKINWIKWMILKLYAGRNMKILDKRGIKSPVFFGIFYTCEMRYEVVNKLLDSYTAYADEKKRDLELMFHSGNLEAEYELLDSKSKELKEFYMSENRFYEAQCLKKLKESLCSKEGKL
jgi:predicted glycoside hydrolase/deacetylase ChbG (UPF0249 family)